MWLLTIFSATVVAAVVAAIVAFVKYLYAGSRRPSTIPGMEASHSKMGNIPDILKAGSLHEFLQNLHERFGDIASFWYGETYFTSIASPALFKQHSRVFDRPPQLFMLQEPLMTLESIQFANGTDGRARRDLYDPCFSHEAVESFQELFLEVARDFVIKLQASPPEEHIPLEDSMFTLAIKAIVNSCCGSFFKDDAKVMEFKKSYDIAMAEMGSWLCGDTPDPESTKRFEEAKQDMYGTMQKVIDRRRNDPETDHDTLFIDTIMTSGRPESQILCDSLGYIVAGFHTSGLLMTWGLYFLACHPAVQDKVCRELEDVLGEEDIPARAIPKLTYLRQVLDETLRCAVVGPYAARVCNVDSELGGYQVPAGTPVVHALGVVLQDNRLWPLPRKFDPDRFSPENSKKIQNYSFEPFGFAGKRKCPGYRFSYSEVTVVFATLLRKYKFKMVPGQDVTPAYGFVTKPKEEIWITAEKR